MTQHSTTADPAERVDSDHRGPARRRPRGLSLAAALFTVALVAVGGATAVAGSAGSSAAMKEGTATSAGPTVAGTETRATARHDTDTHADSEADALVAPDAQPVPDPQPAPASPGDLELSTNSIDLPDNVYDGNFEVRNDGGSPIDWQWLMGDYGIAVNVEGGTLAPGEAVLVHFSINPFQLPVGDFLFANSVYTDDQAKDLHITGHRPQFKVNPDLQQPGLGFTK